MILARCGILMYAWNGDGFDLDHILWELGWEGLGVCAHVPYFESIWSNELRKAYQLCIFQGGNTHTHTHKYCRPKQLGK